LVRFEDELKCRAVVTCSKFKFVRYLDPICLLSSARDHARETLSVQTAPERLVCRQSTTLSHHHRRRRHHHHHHHHHVLYLMLTRSKQRAVTEVKLYSEGIT